MNNLGDEQFKYMKQGIKKIDKMSDMAESPLLKKKIQDSIGESCDMMEKLLNIDKNIKLFTRRIKKIIKKSFDYFPKMDKNIEKNKMVVIFIVDSSKDINNSIFKKHMVIYSINDIINVPFHKLPYLLIDNTDKKGISINEKSLDDDSRRKLKRKKVNLKKDATFIFAEEPISVTANLHKLITLKVKKMKKQRSLFMVGRNKTMKKLDEMLLESLEGRFLPQLPDLLSLIPEEEGILRDEEMITFSVIIKSDTLSIDEENEVSVSKWIAVNKKLSFRKF